MINFYLRSLPWPKLQNLHLFFPLQTKQFLLEHLHKHCEDIVTIKGCSCSRNRKHEGGTNLLHGVIFLAAAVREIISRSRET